MRFSHCLGFDFGSELKGSVDRGAEIIDPGEVGGGWVGERGERREAETQRTERELRDRGNERGRKRDRLKEEGGEREGEREGDRKRTERQRR